MTDPIAPSVTATDVELRVLIRGLKLGDDTRKLIDAAIRSAVLAGARGDRSQWHTADQFAGE